MISLKQTYAHLSFSAWPETDYSIKLMVTVYCVRPTLTKVYGI